MWRCWRNLRYWQYHKIATSENKNLSFLRSALAVPAFLQLVIAATLQVRWSPSLELEIFHLKQTNKHKGISFETNKQTQGNPSLPFLESCLLYLSLSLCVSLSMSLSSSFPLSLFVPTGQCEYLKHDRVGQPRPPCPPQENPWGDHYIPKLAKHTQPR